MDRLANVETKLNHLLVTLTSTPTAAGAPTAAQELLTADDSLTDALDTLCIHQLNYGKIVQLRLEARMLEDQVKGIVHDIVDLGNDISAARDEDEDEDEGEDGSDESINSANQDINMEGAEGMDSQLNSQEVQRKEEIDCRLLLDFARRISRFNTQAAADATAGISKIRSIQADGAPRQQAEGPGTSQLSQDGVGVAGLSMNAINWLNETASWMRLASTIPFPSEEQIRMGIMGRLQAAAAEGLDPKIEVERMMTASKQVSNELVIQPSISPSGEAMAIAEAGQDSAVQAVNRLKPQAPNVSEAPVVLPREELDFDLYNPDEDDS